MRDITGARTIAVISEFAAIREVCLSVMLHPGVSDQFVWKWTVDGEYSAASAYRAFFFGSTELAGAREVWVAPAPPNVRFFFWLALHGRLWTAARRMRHGLQSSANCALCGQADETVDHLLTSCVFTREVWFRTLQRANMQQLAPGPDARLGL
jgi:hypothetical protein